MSVKFAEKNTYGKQIEIATPMLDALKATLADKSSSPEKRQVAARILAHYNDVANKAVPTELDGQPSYCKPSSKLSVFGREQALSRPRLGLMESNDRLLVM